MVVKEKENKANDWRNDRWIAANQQPTHLSHPLNILPVV